MIYYIAGPMTGYENHNKAAFNKAEKTCLSLGAAQVINPITLDEKSGLDLSGSGGFAETTENEMLDVIRRDADAVAQCDCIYMLSGWEYSTGARTEHAIAVWAKKKIIYQASK